MLEELARNATKSPDKVTKRAVKFWAINQETGGVKFKSGAMVGV